MLLFETTKADERHDVDTKITHETDRVVASASREKRTWSPARRKAQELRQLRKKTDEITSDKKEPKKWSEARRAAQVRAKQEREAQQHADRTAKAGQPRRWSQARWDAQKTISLGDACALTQTNDPQNDLTDFASQNLECKQQNITTLEHGIPALQSRSSNKKHARINKRRGFCIRKFGDIFKLFKRTRRALRFIKKNRSQNKRTKKIFVIKSAKLTKKRERFRYRIFLAWKKYKELKLRQRAKKRAASKPQFRKRKFYRQKSSSYYVVISGLKSFCVAKRFLSRHVAWYDRWTLYFLRRLRRRLRIVSRLNVLLRDTYYFHYYHPFSRWYITDPEIFEKAKGLRVFYAMRVAEAFADAYALQKRPFEGFLDIDRDFEEAAFGSNEQYWVADNISDEEIEKFSDEELMLYAHGKFKTRKKVPVAPARTSPPSTVFRLLLVYKDVGPRKVWRQRLWAELSKNLQRWLQVNDHLVKRKFEGTPFATTSNIAKNLWYIDAAVHYNLDLVMFEYNILVDKVEFYWPRETSEATGNVAAWSYDQLYRARNWPLATIARNCETWPCVLENGSVWAGGSFLCVAEVFHLLFPAVLVDRVERRVYQHFLKIIKTLMELFEYMGEMFDRYLPWFDVYWPEMLPGVSGRFREQASLVSGLNPNLEFFKNDREPNKVLNIYIGGRPQTYSFVLADFLRRLGFSESSFFYVRRTPGSVIGYPLISDYVATELFISDDEFFEFVEADTELYTAQHRKRMERIRAITELVSKQLAIETKEKETKKSERLAKKLASRVAKPDGWSPARRAAYEKSKALRAASLSETQSRAQSEKFKPFYNEEEFLDTLSDLDL